jgi:serine/threonine-protein kinase
MLEIGAIVDEKYKILDELGHGGMCTVYLAINEKANKLWAIKEVRKSYDKNFEILKQSLIAETDLLKKLTHPNLPSIVDIINSDENFLIVMDYIEGITLEKLLSEEGVQPQEKVVGWALQLCDVLNYLHTLPVPIIYRDMKPSNIMLKSNGNVVLIDFGTAREFKDTKESDTTCLGTRGYAAPEQFGGMGQTDARTDIYSLGATMYQLVTGHNPSQPPYEMYPITYWNSGLSTGLERIIQKCICKNPADRYQSVNELRDELEHYHDLETKVQKIYRKRVAVFAVTILLAVGAAALGAGFMVAADKTKSSEYEDILDIANITGNPYEACKLYMDAVAVDSSRAEAYHMFYKKVIEDGIFDDNEEELFVNLSIGTRKYLQNFQNKNEAEYADFCYEIGNAYWYYYIHGENRQSRAVSWYQTAMDYYGDNNIKAEEYRRCNLYVKIGSFHKYITSSRIEGTDAGMYGDYWRSLEELKSVNDMEPDRDVITLRIYTEIVSRVIEYTEYFKDDGITRGQIDDMLKSIEAGMNEMDIGATSTTHKDIEKIRKRIGVAYREVNEAYGV